MNDANTASGSLDTDEITVKVENTVETLCDHKDGDYSEVHNLWATLRDLFDKNRQLEAENERLRAELKEVRINDMNSAVVGVSFAPLSCFCSTESFSTADYHIPEPRGHRTPVSKGFNKGTTRSIGAAPYEGRISRLDVLHGVIPRRSGRFKDECRT